MIREEKINAGLIRLAYIRVSTKKQNMERQYAGIKAWYPDIPEEAIYTDKSTGSNFDRVGIQALMSQIKFYKRQGLNVEVYIHEFTRLGRNYDETKEIYDQLQKMGIGIYCPEFLKHLGAFTPEFLETTIGKGMKDIMTTLFFMFAAIELEQNRKRSEEGYAIYSQKCLEQGIKRGRPTKSYDKDLFMFYYGRYKKGEITAEAIMQGMNLSKNKFYRILKEEGLSTKNE